jgi:hypothetical protein
MTFEVAGIRVPLRSSIDTYLQRSMFTIWTLLSKNADPTLFIHALHGICEHIGCTRHHIRFAHALSLGYRWPDHAYIFLILEVNTEGKRDAADAFSQSLSARPLDRIKEYIATNQY